MKLLFVLESKQNRNISFLFSGFYKNHQILFRDLSDSSPNKVTSEDFLEADKIFVTQSFHKTILSHIVYPHKKEIINLKINPLIYGNELKFILNEKLKSYF